MKKILLMAAFCAANTAIFAQEHHNHKNPPEAVQRSWQKEYSNRENEPWEYRNNQWHTKYKDKDHDNRNVDAYYDKNGKRLYSQSEWNRNELPTRVQDEIKRKYHSDNYSAYRIEGSNGKPYYQVKLSNNKVVYLDEEGRQTTHRY